jgi:hypothetical protein
MNLQFLLNRYYLQYHYFPKTQRMFHLYHLNLKYLKYLSFLKNRLYRLNHYFPKYPMNPKNLLLKYQKNLLNLMNH